MLYAAFDTETTGLSYTKDRIIELGAVIVDDSNNEIVDRFSARINPHRSINPGAQAVHGISRKELEDEPEFKEVIYSFVDFLYPTSCIVAHNARFDINFIMCGIVRMRSKMLFEVFSKMLALDTMLYSRSKYNDGKGNSLDDLADRLNVDRNERKDIHGALIDSELLAGVIMEIEDRHNIETKYVYNWTNLKKIKEVKTENVNTHVDIDGN